MSMIKHEFTCCICGKHFVDEYGNNPSPVKEEGECCDDCNWEYVVPARIMATSELEVNRNGKN